MEREFALKDDGDMVFMDNSIISKHRSSSASQIDEPLNTGIMSHQESGDRNTLDSNLDSHHAEIEVELTDFATFGISLMTEENSFKAKNQKCFIEIKRYQGCDNSDMFVPTSDSGVKTYCCIYCLKRYQNLARHLQTVHKKETEVQNFQAFRPGRFFSLILVHIARLMVAK